MKSMVNLNPAARDSRPVGAISVFLLYIATAATFAGILATILSKFD